MRIEKSIRSVKFSFWVFLAVLLAGIGTGVRGAEKDVLKSVRVTRGICVLLEDIGCRQALRLARETELLVYVQLSSAQDLEAARREADAAGFYGRRIYVESGAFSNLHLADNLADVLIAPGDTNALSEAEVLRVLRPRGKAYLGEKELTKPFPAGADDWSHPYHGPDNNPRSQDQIARAPYLTQFLAEPRYAPLPQVAVASAGRVFKAFGHIAFKAREEPLLNSLVAFNGYNGVMLWKRDLVPGIMVHRNCIIATPELLFVSDDESCKLIDSASGQVVGQIKPPTDLTGGTFWKWMALEDGLLYALIGEQEPIDPVMRGGRADDHGWPWDPLSPGFNQAENPWGFGRNLLAIDPKTRQVLWSHRETEPMDSRALCLKSGRIYIYRHGAYLACLNARNGEPIWRRTPDDASVLFKALGPHSSRQGPVTNWRTTAYLKCSDQALYFAGPQIGKLLAVSAEEGRILWENDYNNFQLILGDKSLYAISSPRDVSKKFDLLTGEVLAELPFGRVNCTRPTGSIDSIFFRAAGGSSRLDLTSLSQKWVSPMRPQCHDGVTITNGLLYWWPSTCDCQNSLYGISCLGPAGDFDFTPNATEPERLELGRGDVTKVARLSESSADWPTFRANNLGTATTDAFVSRNSSQLWQFTSNTPFTPTAPVAVGDHIFFSGSDGIVRALDAADGQLRWQAYTGGAVRFPPTVWQGRLFVGSGDGWVYVFEAVTGRLLWRFNAAPAKRKIPVYGSLMSTWPVASGVLVDDGIAYFAAGIVNFDGTYVYALDAVTGRIKWQNNTSGHLNAEARTGVSVQGHMLIHAGKLYLAGGTAVSPAVYDMVTGKCLNDPAPLKVSRSTAMRGQELYKLGNKIVVGGPPLYGHPEYRVYDPTVTNKLLHTSAHGRNVLWVNSWLNRKKLVCLEDVDEEMLDRCLKTFEGVPNAFVVDWDRMDIPVKPLWEYDCSGSVGIARSSNAVLFARTSSGDSPGIEVLDIANGQVIWKWDKPLPARPVSWGVALDRAGRMIVSLKNGSILCFGSKR